MIVSGVMNAMALVNPIKKGEVLIEAIVQKVGERH
jgi:hypothetical protein